jgi:6,7-dimethyl-8-ribityllumazine synthase
MAVTGNTTLIQWQAGTHDFSGACVVLVRTEWNAPILDELEKGCRKILGEHGVSKMITITVPGAVEIPFAVKQYHGSYKTEKADAFIALGCVIRGGTPHFEYVCQSVTDGVTQLNLTLDVPVIYGILTVENEVQAQERLGGVHGHKGEEAALTALKMIALNNQFR